MGPIDVGKFVEDLFQWEAHRVAALVMGALFGVLGAWLVFRGRIAPSRREARENKTKATALERENQQLRSELNNLRNQQLESLHAHLDELGVPRGGRRVKAWTVTDGRKLPVCIKIESGNNCRVWFPDGKEDKVATDQLSEWPPS